MTSISPFEIKRYDFNSNIFDDFQNHHAQNLWPIVYILSDGSIKEAYVGETTDTYSRMSTHLKSSSKNILSTVHLITSEKFNKSATLDIESNLIKYISGDGEYKLMNGNVGLANHNYYQKKEVYWDIFKSVWSKLRSEGIAKHSIEHIDNSDLFKYSPYKSLNAEQREGLLLILRSLIDQNVKNIVVQGGAGTGKTILAVFLFKLLNTDNSDFNFKELEDNEDELIDLITLLKAKYPNPKMALVVPMSSFRNTLKKTFKNIKGLNSSMVIGPSELAYDTFDIVVVDESHRLRRRVNIVNYRSFDEANEKLGLDKNNSNELNWVEMQSKKAVLFYDENQSIRPSDVKKVDFDKLKLLPATKVESLKSQFRVKGGNGYVNYLNNLLSCNAGSLQLPFKSRDYEFILFDNIESMVSEIKTRNKQYGLARLIAGFSWPWISRGNDNIYDIQIENYKLKWNSVTNDFINSTNAINEVGCIHTTQGYDLNYAGIIFGNEISYDPKNNEIIILAENYHDRNGKQSIKDPQELKDFIINIYKTIMLRGIKGTYVYVCDTNLREYFAKHIEQNNIIKTIRYVNADKILPFINAVPVYNLKAVAGIFSDKQIVDVEDYDWVEIPSRYKPSKDLFACEVVGESMNKVIPNGSLCLFRKYSGGSRNGKIVLVESANIQDPDLGAGYTIKEYTSKKNDNGDQWYHEEIILKPLSTDSKYSDIIIREDELTHLRVIATFECVL